MEVEALAAIKAVEFGSELGLHNSIIEGDSVVVSKALECKEFGLAPYAHLLKDVSLFSGFYSQFSYSHIKKDGNEIIHSLVRLALTSQQCILWIENVPSYTLPFVQTDLTALWFFSIKIFILKK